MQQPSHAGQHLRHAIFALLALLIAIGDAHGQGSLDDSDVTAKIEEELRFDRAVSFDAIDVRTISGVVTLSGSVRSILARERVTRIAETVRGVRSVINRIQVAPREDVSGLNLQAKVQDALRYDAATDAYDIVVSADDAGRVTLSGTVDSWQERDLAGIVAKGVSGVTGIENALVVKLQPDRNDADIAAEVRAKLRWDTLVDDAMIDVTVSDRKVILGGVVGSAAEKRRARQGARVAGVKEVEASDLHVAEWAREEQLRTDKYLDRPDAEIQEAVKDGLFLDPRVSDFKIAVSADNGHITLTGVVDNIQARRAAGNDAKNTVGVLDVRNLIKVRPPVDIDDDQIAQQLREALTINPFIEMYDIRVDVNDQVAYLDGTVDSHFEKAEAENVASRATGVIEVRNRLTVDRPDMLTYDPYTDDWSIYDFPWYTGSLVAYTRSDQAIAEDIRDELFWSPFVDAGDIRVTVDQGVAALSGRVDSWTEDAAAIENAFEGGAVTVVNKLEID